MVLLPACGLVDKLSARRTAREGNTLYANADFKGAVHKYREAITLDPETPNVYLNLGFALYNLYRPGSDDEVERNAAAEASKAFAKHSAIDPKDTKATTFRIKTLLRAAPEDPALADEAQALFESMLAKTATDAEARQYLVAVFVEAKRYRQAVLYYTPELEKNPKNIEAMKILAIVADKSGLVDEAIHWYRKRAEVTEDKAARAVLEYETATYVWNLLHYSPDRTAGVAGLRWADLGIEAAKRAIALKPDYGEAFVYANLLYLARANREATDHGKEACQRVAYEFRSEAAKLLRKP
ncbi:tetratricopeptide repeat protein [Myxococcota bacterium]|nr:tetratricopeptide repeat protein [Myxococcota bacterium]